MKQLEGKRGKEKTKKAWGLWGAKETKVGTQDCPEKKGRPTHNNKPVGKKKRSEIIGETSGFRRTTTFTRS